MQDKSLSVNTLLRLRNKCIWKMRSLELGNPKYVVLFKHIFNQKFSPGSFLQQVIKFFIEGVFSLRFIMRDKLEGAALKNLKRWEVFVI